MRLPFVQPGVAVLLALACSQICLAQSATFPTSRRDPRQLFQQALAAQQQGHLQTAARDYKELLRLQPHLVAAQANLGVVLAGLGRLDEAIVHDRAALDLVPGNPGLLLNLGLAYYKKNDFAHAATQFNALHRQSPDDLRVSILLGECDLHLGQAAAAATFLQPLTASHPGDLDLDWVLGQALIQDGKLREGVQHVTRVARQRKSAEAWALAARTYIRIEDFKDARTSLDAALRLNSQLPGLATLDGMICSYEGNDAGAAAAFRKALAADPNDAEAHLYLGTVLYAQHQLDAAYTQLDRALRLQPGSALARYELARVEKAQGHTAAAIQNLEMVERAEPDWLKPHIELAALYFRRKRPRDGARERNIVDRLSARQQQNAMEPNLNAPVPVP